MTNISTVDALVQALWDAQDATEPVSLILTSVSYDLSSSSFERDERFGSGLTESCLPHITTDVTIDVDTPFDFSVLYQDNPMYRLFYVVETGRLTLSHLKLRSGDVGWIQAAVLFSITVNSSSVIVSSQITIPIMVVRF